MYELVPMAQRPIAGWDSHLVRSVWVATAGLIHKIDVQYLVPMNGVARVIMHAQVRLDQQKPLPSGGLNWQIQVNGKFKNSTVAAVLVPIEILTGPGTHKVYLCRKIKDALFQSRMCGKTYKIEMI